MANKPVFFDVSGRRRKIVNFLLPIFIITFILTIVYVVFYVSRLDSINKLVGTKSLKSVTGDSHTALFYNDNHPQAYSVVSDQIENLDSILIPKYQVNSTSITTPASYDGFIKDISFISNNKPVHYNRYFVLSSKNYSLLQGDRDQQAPTTYKVDSQLPTLITINQMLTIRDDLYENKVRGLYIDMDLGVIKNAAISGEFNDWFNSFQALLKDKDIDLGLMVQPNSINKFNSELIKKADMDYINFSKSDGYGAQVDKLVSQRALLSKNVIYEVPTASREQNAYTKNPYVKSVDYVTEQERLINIPQTNRTLEPITFIKSNIKYQILDAVSAFKFTQKLNTLKMVTGTTQFGISNPGYEEYTTWKLLQRPFDIIRNNYLLSQDVIASRDIKTIGNGQIYSIDTPGTFGTRKIELNSTGDITSTTVLKSSNTPIVTKVGRKPKKIALTFDDGPNPTETKQVLDILDKYRVKGTFFEIGANVRAYPDVSKLVVDRGNEVENHTFDHPVFSKLTTASQVNEIKAASEIIEQVTGQRPHYFRKPYSDNNIINTESDLEYLKTLKSLGLQASEYDIDSKDWLLDNSDEVVNKVISDLNKSSGDYSQILFHDSHSGIDRTLDALPKIIKYLQSQNIQIVRVDQLDSSSKTPVTNAESTTTDTYRAINVKDKIITFIVGLNIILITLAMLRYAVMILGATVYGIKQRFSKIFFNRIDNSLRQTPRLNVIIACYNEELVIGRTIESLLENTYKNKSIIVVNDGSTDKTREIVEYYANKYKDVRLINVPNGGKSKALQSGIKYARSKWIVFCDADTLFEKDALYHFTNTFFTNKNIGAVAGRITVGNDINAITRSQVIEYGVAHTFIKSAQDVINSIAVVPGASGLWSRAALEEIGGFTDDTLAEDADATLKLIGTGRRVKYNSNVIAKTEAPSSTKMMYKQRTRWQLGNMQAAIKHSHGLFNKKYGILGYYGLPMFYVELVSTLLYPFLLGFSGLVALNSFYKWSSLVPRGVSFVSSRSFLWFSLSLLITELVLSIFVILIEKKPILSKVKLLLTLPFYLIIYKTFLSYTTIVSMLRALRGTFHGWGHLSRTATVK